MTTPDEPSDPLRAAEPAPQTPRPQLPARTVATCARIKAKIARRDAVPSDAPTAAPAGRTARQQQQLPLFKDAYAVPNALLRAALFPAREVSALRRLVKDVAVFAVEGIQVTFTGEEFDQTDLDVLLGILQLGAHTPLGQAFAFSGHALLKLLGRSTGGHDHEWLHRVVTRLCVGKVEIRHNRLWFMGGFLLGAAGNLDTQHYSVAINPQLALLFGCDMWSQLDRMQRAALGRNGTAKALHGYYSSHAKPGSHRIETLAQIAGLQAKQRAVRKRQVLKAHDALKAPACGFLKDYTVEGESITVEKTSTPSQARHLAKQATKKIAGKKRGPTPM